MPKAAIIIPCYNEFNRIVDDSFLSFLNANPSFTLVFVNDGSSDDTLLKLQNIASRSINNQVIVISNFHNQGKAASVRQGVLKAYEQQVFDYIGFMDADLSTPFSEMEKLLNYLIEENKTAVFGSRFKHMGADIDRTFFRHFVGRIFATLIGATIQLPFYDTQCGAKFFRRELIPISFTNPFITKWLFDVEIIMRLKKSQSPEALSNSLSEYPLSVWKEVEGSKLNWKDVYRIPIDLLRIYFQYRGK
jgi:dolichyl-phosphate beta-glucosyltransferase